MFVDPFILPGDVTSVCDELGLSEWRNFTEEKQKYICWQATQDIIGYTGTLDRYIDAAIYRAVFLIKHGEARDAAENIRLLSNGSYSDGSLSVNGVSRGSLDPLSKSLVDKQRGYGSGEFVRG